MDPNSDEEGSLTQDGKSGNDVTFKAPLSVEHLAHKDGETEKGFTYIPDPLTSESPPVGIFAIEVVKNGALIERRSIDKARITFGRSRDADFPMDHPSLSRFHACLLWNPKDGVDGSFFLIDLNSVHGTLLNKVKIPGGKPIRINVANDIIKLGGSSRLFLLTTSRKEDEEEEDEDQVIGLGEEGKKKGIDVKEEEDQGCTWGFKDDDDDDDGLEGDHGTPLGAILSLLQTGIGTGPTKNEHAYSGNPQKTIQHWFDSEGYDFEFKVDHHNGKFKCSLELPIDGQDVTIESDQCLKKKDSLHSVCLKACQILDKAELLFPWQKQRESKRKKDGSSDSDDELIDETDQYKAKKAKRLAAKSGTVEVLNFDSLNVKWKELSEELQKLKAKLATMSVKTVEAKSKVENDNLDALDAFMEDIGHTSQDAMKSSLDMKIEKSKLRLHIMDLEKEQQRVERLIKIAKPSFTLPVLESIYTSVPMSSSTATTSKPKEEKLSPKKPEIDEKIYKPLETNVKKAEGTSFTEKEPAKKPELDTEGRSKIEISFAKKSLIKKPAPVFSSQDDEAPKPKMGPLPQKERGYGLIIKNEKPKTEKAQEVQKKANYFNEEAYVEWMPPANQTGDGKTSLNEKYGY